MAEFLCDTLRSDVYTERDTYRPRGRDWTDLPVSTHERDSWTYRIPLPADYDPISIHELSRVREIGVRRLLSMISILGNLNLSDQELRGLLHCYEYLHYEREPWWGERRGRNVI